nr:MAG TPA: hypothetical protein [Bacteriophage sp.]
MSNSVQSTRNGDNMLELYLYETKFIKFYIKYNKFCLLSLV